MSIDDQFFSRTVPQFSSRRWRYSRIANQISIRRRSPLVRALVLGANALLDAYNNVQFCIDTDGESRLLRIMGCHQPSVVFDVGANIGDWAVVAARSMPTAMVHCFELDHQTRQLLMARLGREPGSFVVAGHGMDRTEGRVGYDYYHSEPALSSIIPLTHTLPAERRSGWVTTGDRYMERAGVDTIDLLKVDVEGAEGRVLEGFGDALGHGRIRVIQFEYGLANIASRTLLADMYERLGDFGFLLGRLYPDAVDFRPYEVTDESFRGSNFVGVLRREAGLIEALRMRG